MRPTTALCPPWLASRNPPSTAAGDDHQSPAVRRAPPAVRRAPASPLSRLWRGAGGEASRPLLIAGCLALLAAGAACSGANNGYGAKHAPPATATTQIAAAQVTTGPLATPATTRATPAVTPGAPTAAASANPATATAATPSATPAAPLAVGIAGFAFAPAALHVPVGGAVVWTNNDAVTHTVTPDAGGIDAHELAPGASFTQTFTSPGTYGYHCAIHPFMKGSIVVG